MSTWSQRVIELKETGLSFEEIGEMVDLAPTSVRDLATGYTKEPRGESAVKLYLLHADRCSKSESWLLTTKRKRA